MKSKKECGRITEASEREARGFRHGASSIGTSCLHTLVAVGRPPRDSRPSWTLPSWASLQIQGRGQSLAAAENRRPPMTLSDQLAVPDSSDLRDLLRTHNSSRRRRRRRSGGGALTLASVIAADKTSIPSSSSARTLLDALREDEEAPVRLSLMALLEEEEEEVGQSWRCCVCMTRQKGAAFIPCGHTFCCRCSREVWVRRRSCPLCNAAVDNILNIY